MIIPTKQLKNGFTMPVFGLGTWEMGGRLDKDTTHDSDDIQAIRQAIDVGISHIDTAEKYAAGHAEELVGEAIQGYDRAKLFIASKVRPENFKYDDVLKAVENSLKRLKTEYLNLCYLHSPNDEVSIEETMKAMDTLQEEGLVKNIAVSNFTIERFEQAQSVTSNKIVANQLHLNL